jgi:hypothetical protein
VDDHRGVLAALFDLERLAGVEARVDLVELGEFAATRWRYSSIGM